MILLSISSRKSETKVNRMGFNNTVKTTTMFKSWLTTWNNFWERTSISGLSNASGAKSRYRRYFWILIFAIFTVMTIRGLDDVFKDYEAHPVMTSVTVKHNNQVYNTWFLLIFIHHKNVTSGYILM